MFLGIALVVCTLATGPATPSRERAKIADTIDYHVRASDPLLRAWIRNGGAESKTLNALLAALTASDVIVHVVLVDRIGGGGTRLRGKSDGGGAAENEGQQVLHAPHHKPDRGGPLKPGPARSSRAALPPSPRFRRTAVALAEAVTGRHRYRSECDRCFNCAINNSSSSGGPRCPSTSRRTTSSVARAAAES